MGLAKNYGICFQLIDEEQKHRAEWLITKNSRKYELTDTWCFYHVTQGEESERVLHWVQTGEGVEPDGELPTGW